MAVSLPLVLRGSSSIRITYMRNVLCQQAPQRLTKEVICPPEPTRSIVCKHEILNTNSRDTEIYGPKILLSSVWRGRREHAYAVRSLDRHLLDYQVCSRRVQKALMRLFDANRIEVRGAPILSGSMRAFGIEWVLGNDNGRILSTAIVVLQNDISGDIS
ncbi:hypothetical protein E4U57_008081, partial [Claviceps arundinis]